MAKDPIDVAQGQFNRAIRLAESRPRPKHYFGFFHKEPHVISAAKMREALLGGYKAKLEQLPKEVRDKAMDYIDRRDINFSTVKDVQNVIDAAIKLAFGGVEALQTLENNQYGSPDQRRSCGTCGVKEGRDSPLQLLLDHLLPIDVKPYCPKCFVAAYTAAQGEYNARLSVHAQEERRRSKPDDEL